MRIGCVKSRERAPRKRAVYRAIARTVAQFGPLALGGFPLS